MFELSQEEYRLLRTQIASLEIPGKGKHSKYSPFAFTEHGVTALANILNSERAIEMGIAVVRAFIALKKLAFNQKRLAEQIEGLKKAGSKTLRIFAKNSTWPVKLSDRFISFPAFLMKMV